MKLYRESIHNIKEEYTLLKNRLEADYELLGLADDVFISTIKYYFSPKGFGAILSNDILTISGNTKKKVENEISRLKKK